MNHPRAIEFTPLPGGYPQRNRASSRRALRKVRRHPLTPRQLQVLGHIAYGLSDAEISTALGISENRVTNITRTIRSHLHARSRSHAVAIWLVGLGITKTTWPR